MAVGRPRNPAVDEAIRRAALDLTVERGYRGVSMEGIAERSGVAKQTIYRRFRTKGEVILDALVTDAAHRLPPRAVGSFRDDLAALLRETFEALNGRSGILNRALVAEALQDEEFARLLRERHIMIRRDVVREIIARGRAQGVVRPHDDEFLIDLVFGPMWYRLLIGHGPLDAGYAEALADAVAAVAAPDTRPD